MKFNIGDRVRKNLADVEWEVISFDSITQIYLCKNIFKTESLNREETKKLSSIAYYDENGHMVVSNPPPVYDSMELHFHSPIHESELKLFPNHAIHHAQQLMRIDEKHLILLKELITRNNSQFPITVPFTELSQDEIYLLNDLESEQYWLTTSSSKVPGYTDFINTEPGQSFTIEQSANHIIHLYRDVL